MVNDFFDALSQVINPNFRIPTDSQNRLVLSEEQNAGQEGVGEKVMLKTRGRVFAFSLDQSRVDVFPFFSNTTSGIKKRNDAILFCLDGEQCYVFIIELKSGNPKDGIIQLKAGCNFVEYLLRTISLHYQKQVQFEYRYIIFNTKKSATKRPTKRQMKTPETIGDLQIFLEKCNQTFGIDEFFAC